ncbi:hypothetical protein Goari_019219 [Gossypium aridum]|uniref:Uncharacterized protein n=1 Tax=Gossypium aridum TaxID=34290 RepID=A0A7J8WRZ8_GOSAI|nr:hypothetical protein [Gossypium aridum]
MFACLFLYFLLLFSFILVAGDSGVVIGFLQLLKALVACLFKRYLKGVDSDQFLMSQLLSHVIGIIRVLFSRKEESVLERSLA